jgi:hypothetical protein
MDLSELLIIISSENRKKRNPPLGKTKLLKLAYLVELYYKRITRNRLTNTEWIYFLYGPWTEEYEDVLKKYPFTIEKKSGIEKKEQEPVLLDDEFRYKSENSFDFNTALNNVLTKFLSKSLNDILEYVYFDTEPMLNAKNRKEILSWDVVQDSSYFRIKELHVDKKIKNEVEKKLFEKKRLLNG